MSRPASPKLFQLVFVELARDIVSGRVSPGEELQSEQLLAERFEVSKPVVRAAIQDLESCGLIRVRHGKRSVTTPSREWDLLDESVQEAYRLEGLASELVESLFELRGIFEPPVAALAADRATAEDLAEIERLVEQMERSIAGGDPVASFLLDDRDFHAAIALASKNHLVVATLRALRNVVTTSWTASPVEVGDLGTLLLQHREICDAISRHDGAAASEAMSRHLRWARLRDLKLSTTM